VSGIGLLAPFLHGLIHPSLLLLHWFLPLAAFVSGFGPLAPFASMANFKLKPTEALWMWITGESLAATC
jgi:hypothetical protein